MGTRCTFAGRGRSLKDARCAATPGNSGEGKGQSWVLQGGLARAGRTAWASVEVGPHGQRLLGAGTGSERRAVGARRWHLHTRGPEGASPTPNLTDGETEPKREAFACAHRAVGSTQRSPLLSAHSPRPACLCFSRRGSPSKWAVPPGPPPTSAAGQRGATRQACQEARPKEPSCAEQALGHSPRARKANTGNGKRLKVRSFSK